MSRFGAEPVRIAHNQTFFAEDNDSVASPLVKNSRQPTTSYCRHIARDSLCQMAAFGVLISAPLYPQKRPKADMLGFQLGTERRRAFPLAKLRYYQSLMADFSSMLNDLDHVQLAMPEEDAARSFYGNLFGLNEIENEIEIVAWGQRFETHTVIAFAHLRLIRFK